MDRESCIIVSIYVVILLVLVSFNSVFGYQIEVEKNNNCISEGFPDIAIIGVVDYYNLDYGYCIDFVIQNIGDAPTQQIRFSSDIYIFGFHFGHGEGTNFHPLEPGESDTLPLTAFGEEPPPFIGLVRLKCYARTDNEKDYSNNFFAHSYFIIKLGPIWFFKQMPW